MKTRTQKSSGLCARYYRPDLGRFLTQDTYKGNPWEPWTQNLYAYVGNNPVNYVDPTGHCRQSGTARVWYAISTWAECGGTVSSMADDWASFWNNIFDRSDEVKLFGGMVNNAKAWKIKQDGLTIDDKQWGDKVKHARDSGRDPANAEDRKWLRDTVVDTFKNADEVREGTWAGLGGPGERGPARLFLMGRDVVVTDLNNNFVTILKDGIESTSFTGATLLQ